MVDATGEHHRRRRGAERCQRLEERIVRVGLLQPPAPTVKEHEQRPPARLATGHRRDLRHRPGDLARADLVAHDRGAVSSTVAGHHGLGAAGGSDDEKPRTGDDRYERDEDDDSARHRPQCARNRRPAAPTLEPRGQTPQRELIARLPSPGPCSHLCVGQVGPAIEQRVVTAIQRDLSDERWEQCNAALCIRTRPTLALACLSASGSSRPGRASEMHLVLGVATSVLAAPLHCDRSKATTATLAANNNIRPPGRLRSMLSNAVCRRTWRSPERLAPERHLGPLLDPRWELRGNISNELGRQHRQPGNR